MDKKRTIIMYELQMHGIVIDENKPVIANIDTRERERTGELTFRYQ